MYDDDEISLRFAGSFGRESFTRITRGLYGRPPPSVLSLDLGDVSYAYATGVVPLIALIRHLDENGTEVDIVYPFDDSYWKKAGWRQLLEGEPAPPADTRRSYVPVQAYSDTAELNDSVNAAIEVLARQMDCSPGVLDSVAWTLNELADNVLIHAGEPGEAVEGFMQVVCHREQEKVDLVVSDYGRGVRASLSQSHSVRDDEHALAMAIKAGVTRDRNAGQGNGLAGSVRIVSEAGGELTIISGNAELRIVNGDMSTHVSGSVPGTSVSLVLGTSVEIDISRALWGTPPTSEFEMSHLDERDEIVFRVAEEATGFGNRHTGRQLRTKLQNLMRQFPEARVRVDFTGVALASASFADEFIAKLVVDMGHFSFFARVSIADTNRLISQTLDNVIKQRSQPG